MTEQTSDTEFPPPSAAGPDSPSADPAGAASGGADTGRPAAPAGESRVAQPAILAAMTGHRTEHPPIWFMRQAGRSLPEYRQAREGTTMLESCLDPALAAEITCQPVRRHGVDAAVLYSDIMVPLVLAGVGVRIEPGVGPVLDEPVRTAADVDALVSRSPGDASPVAREAQMVVQELGERTPLIGFAGAPFTIAAYLVEGGPSRDHLAARSMMHSDPVAWGRLMDWVADLDADFLSAQTAGGARAVQLFDSWAGSLSEADYVRHVAPHSTRALSGLDRDLPVVHFGVNATHLAVPFARVAAAASDHPVLGVDHRTTLDHVLASLMVGGLTMPLQGNINPALLFAGTEALEAETRAVVEAGRRAPGHIVNLGHGVPATTDPATLTRLVEFVHSL
ncbi:Uroporphyrinogen decarboxylase [Acidipropionibacterium jensenii]|uniref:Uroporphyrinogen decarboxylase n=3 Tax=Acidipropionibacterium jensenii TaxID=1749 RepID=A0A448P0Z1_9ACTN|nr:uroporphyrinogen decarboxylase [Acidipropionibacterium jensenii]VEI03810.1 Uroporphyrinogen decarboxylase [Acidipropionibacterium jensenii]